MKTDFPEQGSLPAEPGQDEELEKARQAAAGACPGCGEEGSRNAFRVKKEGPTQGRLFIKCRSCGKFDWFGAAPEGAAPADSELAAAQASASLCPECRKPRRALRVRKEGPNQGRLFLGCSDRACDSFEWVETAPAERVASTVRARSRRSR